MNYFLYNPVTQYDNTGDLLINQSLVGLLRKHGQVIIDDSNKPEKFVTAISAEGDQRLSAISSQRLFDFLEYMLQRPRIASKDTYYLVLVPGDLSVVGFNKAISRVRFFYRRLRKLKRLGCRILRLGISLNTFDLPNIIAESLYSRAFYVYGVRDKQSMAKATRFRFSHVHYFPDLAWAYRPNFVEIKAAERKKSVLISFRANQSGTVHNVDYFAGIKNHLLELLRYPAFENYKIIVSYQVKYDREAAQELADLFHKTFDVEFIDTLLSLEEAIQLYAGADLIISNRLHVLLLGSICKTLSVPFINPLENKKIAGIYEDNGLYDMVLDYRDDIGKLNNKLADLMGRSTDILNLLEEQRKYNVHVIENVMEDIVDTTGIVNH